MMWAILTGLEELMQELDVLGRRSQIADGGWLDVFTLRRKGRGGGGRGQDWRHGRGQWIAVDECGAVSIFAGAGLLGEAGWGGGSEVKSLTRQGISFDARSPETRDVGGGGAFRFLKSTKRSRSPWCVHVCCELCVASSAGAPGRSPLPPPTRHSALRPPPSCPPTPSVTACFVP